MVYNVLTCSGFSETAGNWVASTPCLKARLGFVALFFIIAIIRRWGGEEIGLEFNFFFSIIAGLVSYFLIVTLVGSTSWAFIIGLGLSLFGGYGVGFFIGGGGE